MSAFVSRKEFPTGYVNIHILTQCEKGKGCTRLFVSGLETQHGGLKTGALEERCRLGLWLIGVL